MSRIDARSRFSTDGAASASPQRLVVLLYERLVRDLDAAHDFLADGDREPAHHALVHAQQIVEELLYALRPDVWDGGANLVDLYGWILSRLVDANVQKSAAVVAEIRPVVADLHDAWRDAYQSLAALAEVEGVA